MPKGTPPRQQLTRSLNVRIGDEDFDYLARHVNQEQGAPTLSEALRDAITKARTLDELLSSGRVHELVYQPVSPADTEGRD